MSDISKTLQIYYNFLVYPYHLTIAVQLTA